MTPCFYQLNHLIPFLLSIFIYGKNHIVDYLLKEQDGNEKYLNLTITDIVFYKSYR
jgi:hypothetical protein